MAATRRNAMLIAEAREKIRTTQLINRLQDHALGKVDMSESQVRAVQILLRKSLPDLQAVEVTGKDGKDLVPEQDPSKMALALLTVIRGAHERLDPEN